MRIERISDKLNCLISYGFHVVLLKLAMKLTFNSALSSTLNCITIQPTV